MAISFPESRRGAALLLVAGLLQLPQADAAAVLDRAAQVDRATPIDVQGRNPRWNVKPDTFELSDVTLRQGTATLIRAAEAAAQGLTESSDNSRWELTGAVHIEFNDAVLDADSATIVFVDSRLKEVHVKGTPASFSQQLKSAARHIQGRAATIDYDAQTSLVRFVGDTWYTDGRNEVNTPLLTYNMNDGSFTNDAGTDEDSRFHMTIHPGDKRVPPPRTPDRSTAQ